MKRWEVPAGEETIRDQIIVAIKTHLEATTTLFLKSDPTSPPLFAKGKRGTLEDIEKKEAPAFAIEEGQQETDRSFYSHQDNTLRVYVHFKVEKAHGVDVYSLLNYYLGRVEQEVVRPEDDGLQIAGLAMGVTSAGNSIQYNGDSDPEPGATMMFDVDYRHALGNPFMETPNG